ncbi:MAG: nickel pincer cofactor biosynthesis protein LarC [Desulfobacterales bacterium]|nr:nickel pincer cofactor biosynthesis protein LarC [Desulfobacterales bacterium]
MKIAYFDCFSGASGDMILGCLLDAGLSLDELKSELAKLKLSHYDIQARRVRKKGIAGSRALVMIEEDHHRHHHRRLSHIREIIDASDLDGPVRERSLAVFTRLAEAEARVHGIDMEHVHFHEVGAMDAIIDVVGAVAGVAALGIRKVFCSPLHVGAGVVECAHGVLPVPAPAAAELIRGKPVYSTGVQGELLTPTGAALLTTLASGFGPMPPMILETTGYGAGKADRSIPNLLRVSIGEAEEDAEGLQAERAAVIETGIDDMNPQLYDHLMQKLLQMGVMDVFLAPIQMKKNRPGTLLTVLCKPGMVDAVAHFLITETTTIGLRWRIDNRLIADREIKEMDTPRGVIKFKVAKIGNRTVNISPEYEDCKRVAMEQNVPLKEILEIARAAAIQSI